MTAGRQALLGPIMVDTDAASFVLKEGPRESLYRPYLEGRAAFLSFQSLAELRRWALERRWGEERRAKLDAFVKRFVVVGPSEDTCERWAAIMANAKSRGRPMSAQDAWVAATALALGVPLLTGNGKHFAYVAGLTVLVPAPPAGS